MFSVVSGLLTLGPQICSDLRTPLSLSPNPWCHPLISSPSLSPVTWHHLLESVRVFDLLRESILVKVSVSVSSCFCVGNIDYGCH